MKNKKPKYTMYKVFDCQDMPQKVREGFFRIFAHRANNDTYVMYTTHDEIFEDENDQWAQDKKQLDAWLIKNGAAAPKDENSQGETVLINHWW